MVGILATLSGAAVLAILGTALEALREPLTLPLWGCLTVLTLVLILCWGVIYVAQRHHRRRVDDYEEQLQQAECARVEFEGEREGALKDRISDLEEEIRLRDQMTLVDGLCYRLHTLSGWPC